MSARMPDRVTTFADMLAESEDGAARARRSRRPLALRLLTWGQSGNPYLNALLKLEYLATLPLRFVLALIAAPFALHNRPMGATVGFLALFGFWEIWNGFAKEPFLQVNNIEQQTCVMLRYARDNSVKDGSSMGHLMACKVAALNATLTFFWRNFGSILFTKGPRQTAIEFDRAFDNEQKKSWSTASIYADYVVDGSIKRNFGDFMREAPKKPDVPRLTWTAAPAGEHLGELRGVKSLDERGGKQIYLFELRDPGDEDAIRQAYEKQVTRNWPRPLGDQSDYRVEIQLNWPKQVETPCEFKYVLSDVDNKPVGGYVRGAKFRNYGYEDAETQHVYLVRLYNGTIGIGMYFENNTYALDGQQEEKR